MATTVSPGGNGTTSRMATTWLVSIHQFIDQPVRPRTRRTTNSVLVESGTVRDR